MKLVIFRNFREMTDDSQAGKVWLDLIHLRQRLYVRNFSHAMILDKYDLIADHIVLYSSRDWKPIGYVRSVTEQACRTLGQPLPIESVVDSLGGQFAVAYQSFRKDCKMPVNMSYLCMDSEYRSELGGIKPIDLLTWIALMATGIPVAELGYCATPNAKFKLTPWLEQLGSKVEGLASFVHSVIPEQHELVLIPSVRTQYWDEHLDRFKPFWDEAQWIMPRLENSQAA